MTTVSVEVERSAEQVFAYATDPSRFSEWQGGVVSGSMENNGEAAVGDLCRTVRRIGGVERAVTAKVVRVDAPRAWSVHGIDGPSALAWTSMSRPSRRSVRVSPSRSTLRVMASGRSGCR